MQRLSPFRLQEIPCEYKLSTYIRYRLLLRLWNDFLSQTCSLSSRVVQASKRATADCRESIA